MKNRRDTSTDGIPREVLKVVHEVDPNILDDVFNSSLRLGVFPKVWKKAETGTLCGNGKPCN